MIINHVHATLMMGKCSYIYEALVNMKSFIAVSSSEQEMALSKHEMFKCSSLSGANC